MAVKIGRDVLDAHRAARTVALQSEPIDQSYRVGMERIDLQTVEMPQIGIFLRISQLKLL
jgi:hypothetical protein